MSKTIQSALWNRRGSRWPIPVLLVLCLPVFYYNLGSYGIVNGDEGFYHKTAVNIVESGDWLTIQWFGDLRVYDTFMNAPLLPWLRATLITFWGDNYWTMRVLSATAGMLAVMLTYRLGRQFMTSAEAFLAAILLMFSYQFVFLHGARTGELDAIITMLFVWLVYSFIRAVQGNRSFVPHHLGLLVLLTIKLPVIIMPVLFEGAFLVLSPRHRKHAKRWVLTLACMGPFAIIWHVYQFIDLGPEKVISVLGLMSEQASGEDWQALVRGERKGFLSSMKDNALFYGGSLMFGGFPYVLLAPLAAIGVWRHRASGRSRDVLKLVLLAAVVVIFFFCFVARRFPWYVMPAYPFIAILVARFLYRLDRLGRGFIASALLGLAAAVAIAVSFHPEVVNPFEKRAIIIAPKAQLTGILGPTWRVYLPILGAFLAIVVMMVRRYVRLPGVRALPALCIVLVVGVAGFRVADGLRYTNFVSRRELFAQRLEKKRVEGRPIDFPVTVPSHGRGWLSFQYFFAGHYKFSPGTKNPKLVRLLRPDEIPSLRREDLRVSTTPSGAIREATESRPKAPGDGNREGRPAGRRGKRNRSPGSSGAK